MSSEIFFKQPNSTEPVTLDAEEWSKQHNITITSATVTIDDGMTVSSPLISDDGYNITVNISGGTIGEEYNITYILTPPGKAVTRTIKIVEKV